MHRVRKPRQLAVVRELWETRDRIAERRDLAPGRVLPDAAIVEAALALPSTVEELAVVPGFGGRATKRHVGTWFKAVEAGLTAKRLPAVARPGTGPPPPRSWASRDAAAAARLAAAREAVVAIADAHHLPAENLLSPDTVRRLAWEPPEDDHRGRGGRRVAREWRTPLAGRAHRSRAGHRAACRSPRRVRTAHREAAEVPVGRPTATDVAEPSYSTGNMAPHH